MESAVRRSGEKQCEVEGDVIYKMTDELEHN